MKLTFKIGDYLSAIEAMKNQLEEYRWMPKSLADKEHLELDIKGYGMVLATGIQKNAEEFIRVKGEAREQGKKFENNLMVIAYMKREGLWQDKESPA